MKSIFRTLQLAASIAALAACASTAFAQDEPVINSGPLPTMTANQKTLQAAHSALNPSRSLLVVSPSLPLWQYQLVSPIDSNTYSGAIVGGNPFNRGARTTTAQVVLIPLRIMLTGTVRNFDPTSPDASCLSSTAMTLTQQSPLFNNASFTMNGVALGTTNFADAFQRAEFWSSVSTVSPAYHLALNVTTKPVQTITTANNSAGSGASFSFAGDCGTNAVTSDNPPRYAAIDIDFIDAQLNTIITNLGLTANQFPFFVMYRTFITEGPPGNLSGNCCILGYHSTVLLVPANAPGQTYGIADFFGPNNPFGAGTQDISAMSHELMEWVNDPSGVNPTPEWGNIGQVGGCVVSGGTHTPGQSNLEVGDPLSGNLSPAIAMPNGFTYHPQELAFFSWFYGGPSYGAGGKYSSNGTFSGFAKPCATGGGTN
jgi:hypothetical protein